jgi:exodeoxyribonuclease III
MTLRLASWNINSVRLRQENLARLVAEAQPDVICLQETKARDAHFPTEAIAALGYKHQLIHGMKSYNGVAILSRLPLEGRTTKRWCGRRDCRHLITTLPGGWELHNVYVPAGGDVSDPAANPKFAHKLRFLEELAAWFAKARSRRRKMILVGDLNVAPLESDVWSHKQMLRVVSHTPGEVERLNAVQASTRWIDAVRHFVPPDQRLYSWWSYRAQDWAASDRGRRLDHIWVSEPIAPSLSAARVLRDARGWTLPSDHVPVIVDFA